MLSCTCYFADGDFKTTSWDATKRGKKKCRLSGRQKCPLDCLWRGHRASKLCSFSVLKHSLAEGKHMKEWNMITNTQKKKKRVSSQKRF